MNSSVIHRGHLEDKLARERIKYRTGIFSEVQNKGCLDWRIDISEKPMSSMKTFSLPPESFFTDYSLRILQLRAAQAFISRKQFCHSNSTSIAKTLICKSDFDSLWLRLYDPGATLEIRLVIDYVTVAIAWDVENSTASWRRKINILHKNVVLFDHMWQNQYN